MIKFEQQIPAEPRLDDWCTAVRLAKLRQDLNAARDSLVWSGQLEAVLRGWVRRQLVEEAVQSGFVSNTSVVEELEPCPPDWPRPLHKAWLQQDQALLAWAQRQWGHGLESLYLARKSQLDRVTLQMIRVSDMGFSLELYHRIKAGGRASKRWYLITPPWNRSGPSP